MGNIIKVGMADLNVCKAPDGLTTLGLGSCIGLTLYDPVTKIGSMVHYMLPDSTKVSNNSNKAKFADTGIEELLKKVIAAGASIRWMKLMICTWTCSRRSEMSAPVTQRPQSQIWSAPALT